MLIVCLCRGVVTNYHQMRGDSAVVPLGYSPNGVQSPCKNLAEVVLSTSHNAQFEFGISLAASSKVLLPNFSKLQPHDSPSQRWQTARWPSHAPGLRSRPVWGGGHCPCLCLVSHDQSVAKQCPISPSNQ